MNLVIDEIADIVFSFSGLTALVFGSAILALLGKERIPSLPSYGISIAIAFIYTIVATRGMASDTISDSHLAILRVLATLFYAVVFVLAYSIGRKKLRPFSHQPVRKRAKKSIPHFTGMRHSRPRKPDTTPKLR